MALAGCRKRFTAGEKFLLAVNKCLMHRYVYIKALEKLPPSAFLLLILILDVTANYAAGA